MKKAEGKRLDLKSKLRRIPEFKGVVFWDITPLLKDKRCFRECIKLLADHYRAKAIDVVVSNEARGFIVGAALAYELGVGFVPVRKKGKLPSKQVEVTYQLEYGTDSLEIHEDAVRPGQRVLVCDDLLATGGTAAATVQLVRQLGGEVTGAGFAVELNFLNGRAKLTGLDVFSLIQYDK